MTNAVIATDIDKRILREDYRNYDLLSRYWHGAYRGRAWLNNVKLVDIEGNNVDEIIQNLRGFVDMDLLKKQTSKVGSQPTVKEIVAGLRFIIPRLTLKQQALLRIHRKAYGGKMSLHDLKRKAGYPTASKVFQDYVFITSKLSDALAYSPAEISETEQPALSLLFENISNINQLGETTVTLRSDLLQPLQRVDIPNQFGA